MAAWHRLFDPKVYERMQELKCDYTGIYWGDYPEGECMDLYETFVASINDVNIYDILGTCWGLPTEEGHPFTKAGERGMTSVGGSIKTYKKNFSAGDYTPWADPTFLLNKYRKDMGLPPKEVGELPPCVYGNPVIEYFNSKAVREALHIPDSVQGWDMCTGDIDYQPLKAGSQWIWESLKGQYRMLKFSGNTDGAVPTTGTLNWIKQSSPKVLEEWRPYIVNGQTAGFIEEYEGITLGIVNGAGHMAPQFRPAETYHLIFNWIKEEKI